MTIIIMTKVMMMMMMIIIIITALIERIILPCRLYELSGKDNRNNEVLQKKHHWVVGSHIYFPAF